MTAVCIRIAAYAALLASLCGCQQAELRGIERELNDLAAHPALRKDAPKPAAAPHDRAEDATYTLEHLLELAAARAAQVLKAQLATYEAELKLNETSSKILPRIDLRPGYEQPIFQPKSGAAEGFNIPVIVDWNLLGYWQRQRELLVYMKGKEASTLALRLAKKEAKAAVASFYYEYWLLQETLALTAMHAAHAERLLEDARFLRGRGSLSDIKLREAEHELATWRQSEQAQKGRALQSAERLRAFLALPVEARLSAPDPRAYEAAAQASMPTPAACYSGSESEVIAALNVEMADDAARVAKLARWAHFGSTVSAIGLTGNAAGVIGASVFWLLPVLDRNEQQRLVLAARVQAVKARISAAEDEAHFLQIVSELIAQIEDKQRQRSTAAAAVAAETDKLRATRQRFHDGSASQRALQEQQLELARKNSTLVRSMYEVAAAHSKLQVTCAERESGSVSMLSGAAHTSATPARTRDLPHP